MLTDDHVVIRVEEAINKHDAGTESHTQFSVLKRPLCEGLLSTCEHCEEQTRDAVTHTGVLHDEFSQDPLHGREESKVGLREEKGRTE